mmetsp:Transcript_40219/g.72420  ORF Transcript_40219/g.72420 Transcript_40219/m.72420 type:complete len:403 (+) Transcript_40219:148-1356(+)
MTAMTAMRKMKKRQPTLCQLSHRRHPSPTSLAASGSKLRRLVQLSRVRHNHLQAGDIRQPANVKIVMASWHASPPKACKQKASALSANCAVTLLPERQMLQNISRVHMRRSCRISRSRSYPSCLKTRKSKLQLLPRRFLLQERMSLAKKRKIDDGDVNFGGWAKKEAPEPAPCETDAYQEAMQADIFTAPPWMSMPAPLLTSEGASDTDKQIDTHVSQAQVRRFSTRNILEVNATTVRCKLCYKTHPGRAQAEKHVFEAHQTEFEKETEIWHRFLVTSSKRQPPFGWVCKICNLFFPTDQATWRHLGKEVFIRREERHAGSWHEKEDRWGHEQDQECCGDGINVAMGLSFDSVKLFREQAQRLAGQDPARAGGAATGEADSEDDDDEGVAPGPSQPTFIKEF